MATAIQPLTGRFEADPVHSSFDFAVRHMGVSTFRGSFGDAAATLADGRLEGRARAESISIRTPEQFRAHVLGEEFLDARRHPEIAFASSDLRLGEDGSAVVPGELTIRGVTREVTATGTYAGVTEDPYGNQRAALELDVAVDRRDFGIVWQAPLPSGGGALADEVRITVRLELVQTREP